MKNIALYEFQKFTCSNCQTKVKFSSSQKQKVKQSIGQFETTYDNLDIKILGLDPTSDINFCVNSSFFNSFCYHQSGANR